jgi:uncharacterized protein (DUF342 family)
MLGRKDKSGISRDRRSRRRRGDSEASLNEDYLEALEEREENLQEQTAQQDFGPSGTGKITVELAGGGQQAFVLELNFGGDTSLKAEDVTAALSDIYGVTTGVNQDVIAEVACRAQRGEAVAGRFLVAEGTAATPGEDGRIVYGFLEGTGEVIEQLSFSELRAALEQAELDTALEGTLVTQLVSPDEVLADLVAGTEGTSGQDIFGETKTNFGTTPLLQAGQ